MTISFLFFFCCFWDRKHRKSRNHSKSTWFAGGVHETFQKVSAVRAGVPAPQLIASTLKAMMAADIDIDVAIQGGSDAQEDFARLKSDSTSFSQIEDEGEQSDVQAAKQIFVQQSAILDMLGLGDSHGFRNLSPGHGTLH